MRVNVNHPSFITFLENVTNTVFSSISVESYFQLTPEKKLAVQFAVLKLMKNSIKVRAKLTDLELKSFVVVLWKKNEEEENYEFAAILNDIATNFDSVNIVTKPTKRVPRKIKNDANPDE